MIIHTPITPITDTNRLLKEAHSHSIQSVPWLAPLLDPDWRREVITTAKEHLARQDFDAIAFMGLSGALIAPILAMEMNKTLICVRKSDEVRHSYNEVEGDSNARRYIIIDDFVTSGGTVRRIVAEISRFAPRAKCIGVFQHRYPSIGVSRDGM